MLTGFALCAFIVFLMHLADLPVKTPPKLADASPHNEQTKSSSPTNGPATGEPEPPSQKPRYDFYRLLKENQAPVPAKTESPGNTNPPIASNVDGSFILQVASYKTPEDADQLRAKLLLLNLDAKVETVTLRNADVWHRVLIGPIKGHAELTKARTILSENKYEALVLKSTKD